MRMSLGLGVARYAVIASVLVAVTAVLSSQATPAHAIEDCDVSNLTVDSEEQAFLNLINQYRAQNGRSALTISSNLNRAASWMAIDLGDNAFGHVDSLGRDPSERAQDCGFPGGAGENITAGTGSSSAQTAFNSWQASGPHNSNMLNSSYVQIGIARAFHSGSQYGWYWVTNFSLVSDGTCVPAGTQTCGGSGAPSPTPTPNPMPANGSRFYASGSPQIYLMQSGQKRWFPNPATLVCWPGAITAFSSSVVSSVPTGSPLQNREGCSASAHGVPANGTVLYGVGQPQIWVIQNGQKRWVPNPTTLSCWPGPITGFHAGYVDTIPTGQALANMEGCSAPPEGAKFYAVGGSQIFLMQGGQKRWIPNPATLSCWPGGITGYTSAVVNAIPSGTQLAHGEGC